MKKILLLLLMGGALSLQALPLDPQGKQEAQLFNQYIAAVYAQRTADPKAFGLLEKALAQDPDSKYLKHQLVLTAIAQNQPELAKPYINFIEQGENTAEDWNTYASYLAMQADLEGAAQAYEKALALDPDNLQTLASYGLVLSVMDMNTAVEKLNKLAQSYPEIASDIYTQIGYLYWRNRQVQPALSYYEKGIKADSKNPNPRLGRANVYEKTSQYFLMLHELEELENLGYANAEMYARMGSVFLLVKDIPKAEQYFLKTKEADTHNPSAAYFLALLAENRGNYAGAISYLKDSADYEKTASYQLQVSFYQQRLNQPQESIRTLSQAYKNFPDNVEIGFFYGLALNDADSYAKAAQVFKEVLKSRPQYHEARLHYAYALESLKKYKEMEKQLKQLLAEQPKNAAALNLYAYSLAQRGIRLNEAEEYIARALAIVQDEAFIDTQAWIYFKQGKLDQALDLLRSIAPKTVEQNAEIAYHLGAVLAAKGETEKALPYLEKSRTQLKEAEKLYQQIESKN